MENKRYRSFVKAANREPPPDVEYAALAAFDALTNEYKLDRYPAPPEWERPLRAASAAQSGGVFLFFEESEPPCSG